ncbi:hypothetical protein HPB50_012543 [Hyalomma asiaticum]|uniref:Uncharacterized protein n=1 Tax=Hyalomma asiaticum TaxID=266040 RepID=A0ACB7S6E4_HYAAI|nr:hypothetical protein HPB50_012543 [Hyalomma asiaticum]
MDTRLKGPTSTSATREPLSSGLGVSRCFPPKIRSTALGSRLPIPSILRKNRWPFSGRKTTLMVGRRKLTRGRTTGFETTPFALGKKSIVLRGKCPPILSRLRAAGDETSPRIGLSGHRRLPAARQITLPIANGPSSTRHHNTPQPFVDSSFKTRVFRKLRMVRRPSSMAASDLIFPYRNRKRGRDWLTTGITTGSPYECAEAREEIQPQYARYRFPKRLIAGVRQPVLPLPFLPCGHYQKMNLARPVRRGTYPRAVEPSIEAPVVSNQRLADCKLRREEPRTNALLRRACAVPSLLALHFQVTETRQEAQEATKVPFSRGH